MRGEWRDEALAVANHPNCYTTHKILKCGVFWHVTNVVAHQFHGIAAITTEETVTVLRLAGRAIDDGYEVSGDDDAVLAFHFGILGYEGLFYDLHDRDKVR